jgi:hypothetical protein
VVVYEVSYGDGVWISPQGMQVDVDTPAMNLIPEAQPLTDERKEQIRLRH